MDKKKKILVTGATGFIGIEVAKQLVSAGFHPRFLVRRPSRAPLLAQLDAEIVQGDLSSPKSLARACDGVDTVIHLGARAIFEEYDRVKGTIVDGTQNLLQAALDAGASHFIFGSSLLVYDSQEKPINCETPLYPRCGYGEAKVEAEKLLLSAPIKTAIVRLPHVYGSGDLLFHEIRKGRVLYPGNGKNQFAHLHVKDAARLLIAIAEQDWEGVSPVADESAVNWLDYFSLVRTYYPALRIYSVPQWMALLFTYLIYPFRRLRQAPSVNTPGSVISWNLNLPVQKGLLWDELGLKPNYPTVAEGIPAVLDDAVPFRWTHPIQDRS